MEPAAKRPRTRSLQLNASAEPGQENGFCSQLGNDTLPDDYDDGCDGGDEMPPHEPALYKACMLAFCACTDQRGSHVLGCSCIRWPLQQLSC